jgi:hypothetical protein
MDRNIVYPSSIPLDTDVLTLNRNVMVAFGFLAQACLGTNTIIDGLACSATVPASMTVTVGPGSLTMLGSVDTLPYGSLPSDTTDSLLKMGINVSQTQFTLTAPTTVGQSQVYLIEASFLETDINPVVLPYYNANNPAQSFAGPSNSGTAQPTVRAQQVALQLKAGQSANTGSQAAPAADSGWRGLYTVTVAYGQTAITAANISTVPTAPFLQFKLPSLRPGFGSGVQSFQANGNFFVPLGVSQVEVEVWGAGSGSFASVAGTASGGGAGGGYAKRLVTGLTPGQSVPVTVGAGGAGGTTAGGTAAAGGASNFGPYVSASGGGINPLASTSQPGNGATPPGVGIGGDVNLTGSAGQAGNITQGGMGGNSPMGGSQNSGTAGNGGIFPGGGASGAGTGTSGSTPYNGAAGAGGLVVVRW